MFFIEKILFSTDGGDTGGDYSRRKSFGSTSRILCNCCFLVFKFSTFQIFFHSTHRHHSSTKLILKIKLHSLCFIFSNIYDNHTHIYSCRCASHFENILENIRRDADSENLKILNGPSELFSSKKIFLILLKKIQKIL